MKTPAKKTQKFLTDNVTNREVEETLAYMANQKICLRGCYGQDGRKELNWHPADKELPYHVIKGKREVFLTDILVAAIEFYNSIPEGK